MDRRFVMPNKEGVWSMRRTVVGNYCLVQPDGYDSGWITFDYERAVEEVDRKNGGRKVYVVTVSTWDSHHIDSVWTDPALAEDQRALIQKGLSTSWTADVEEFVANVVPE